jgi:hypothetical protein
LANTPSQCAGKRLLPVSYGSGDFLTHNFKWKFQKIFRNSLTFAFLLRMLVGYLIGTLGQGDYIFDSPDKNVEFELKQALLGA